MPNVVVDGSTIPLLTGRLHNHFVFGLQDYGFVDEFPFSRKHVELPFPNFSEGCRRQVNVDKTKWTTDQKVFRHVIF